MMPGKPVRVLSICDDEGIRISRELVLKHEGYDVESTSSNEPLDPTRIRSFHIAILCHSLSPRQAGEITENLRKHNPEIGVLRVYAIRSLTDHYYDADCEVLSGPGQLLEGMRTLCSRLEPSSGDSEGRKRA